MSVFIDKRGRQSAKSSSTVKTRLSGGRTSNGAERPSVGQAMSPERQDDETSIDPNLQLAKIPLRRWNEAKTAIYDTERAKRKEGRGSEL